VKTKDYAWQNSNWNEKTNPFADRIG